MPDGGPHVDISKALELWKKAADRGHPDALGGIALHFYAHHLEEAKTMSPKDLEKAMRWFENIAHNGSYAAQDFLAQCYFHGISFEYDPQQVAWFMLQMYLMAEGSPAVTKPHLALYYALFDGKGNADKSLQYLKESSQLPYADLSGTLKKLEIQAQQGNKTAQKVLSAFEKFQKENTKSKP